MKRLEKGKTNRQWSFGIRSSGEERQNMRYSLHGFGRYLYWESSINWLKPFMEKRKSTISGKYFDRPIPREYSISFHLPSESWSGQMFVYYGAQYDDEKENRVFGGYKIWNFPWSNKTFRSHELLSLDLERFKLLGKGEHSFDFDPPKVIFKFKDGFDGSLITATCYAERRIWTHGCKSFAWLKYFKKPHISTSLHMEFDNEVGSKKGSWKGGTIGMSCKINNESILQAFKNFCSEKGHEFVSGRIEN